MAFETRETKNISPAASDIGRAVLGWYDNNARILPWRRGPQSRPAKGQQSKLPDPYHVWLSEIMLQQTTVATVAPRFGEFLERWPTLKAMAAAPLEDVLGAWAGLGYYARARNLHKCAVVLMRDHGGIFPDTEEALRKLPGIGDYTAAAIAAIAFDRPAVVVDGNIERIVSRLYAVETPLPAAKPIIKNHAREFWPQRRSGDFAQGLMDIGAGVCKPKAPLCDHCPLSPFCAARSAGNMAAFPIKAPKKPRPRRSGEVFVLENREGDILLERRPDKGLLGGMLGLPGGPWTEDRAEEQQNIGRAFAPAKARWRRIGAVTHVFTHFHLTLDVFIGQSPKGFRRKPKQLWVAQKDAQLPTVMKKAVELASNNKGDRR